MKTLPSYPRIRRYYHIVPLPDGRTQLRSFYRSVVVTAPGSPDLVPTLLPLLDGTHPREALPELCPGCSPDEIERLLRVLDERALLEDADTECEDLAGIAPSEAQHVFLSAVSSNPAEVQRRLAAARVLVIGIGGLGPAIAGQLLRSGVRSLSIMASTETERARGSVAVDVLCTQYDGLVGLIDGTCTEPPGDDLAGIVARHDIVVFCNESYAITEARLINSAAREHKTAWLYVGMQGEEAVVGPMVIPGQTACLICYEMRMRSNMTFADEYVSFEEHLARTRGHGHPQGHLEPYMDVTAGLASGEVMKFLTKYSYPVSLGRLVRMSFANYGITFHPVLRVPRCPTCRDVRPVAREWELAGIGA